MVHFVCKYNIYGEMFRYVGMIAEIRPYIKELKDLERKTYVFCINVMKRPKTFSAVGQITMQMSLDGVITYALQDLHVLKVSFCVVYALNVYL